MPLLLLLSVQAETMSIHFGMAELRLAFVLGALLQDTWLCQSCFAMGSNVKLLLVSP